MEANARRDPHDARRVVSCADRSGDMRAVSIAIAGRAVGILLELHHVEIWMRGVDTGVDDIRVDVCDRT